MNIHKFLNVFTSVVLILLLVFDIYLVVNQFVLKKSEVKGNIDYSERAKSFDGNYVEDTGYLNTSYQILSRYVEALKLDHSKLDLLLIDSIKKDDNTYINIANHFGDQIYIKEVRMSNDELLIIYSTFEDESDTNIMLCKLNVTDSTFIICYDSHLEGV